MSRQHDPQSSSGSTGSSLSWEVEQVLTGHKYSRASLDSDSRARVGGQGGGVSGGVLALVLALEEGGVGAPVVQSWEDGAVVWTSSLIVSCGPAGLLQVLLKDLHWRPAAALQHRLTWHHVIHFIPTSVNICWSVLEKSEQRPWRTPPLAVVLWLLCYCQLLRVFTALLLHALSGLLAQLLRVLSTNHFLVVR